MIMLEFGAWLLSDIRSYVFCLLSISCMIVRGVIQEYKRILVLVHVGAQRVLRPFCSHICVDSTPHRVTVLRSV